MNSASRRLWRTSPLTYVALVLATLFSIYPFYYMVVIATRSLDSINDVPPPVTPSGSFGDNFGRVLDNEAANFLTGLLNSVIVSGIVTVSVVITGSLAGFAFAKLRFRGRNALLLTIIVTMMIPTQLGLIPLWGMIQDLNWFDTLYAVTVPFLVSAFGVFMMRQYATQAISDELIEAGRVDGASTFRIYWSIVLPALRPAAAVLGLLTFMETWNSFLWPYAVLTSENPTLQVSLAFLSYAYYTDYSQVFAATAVGTLPLVIVFIVFGRQIVGGIMEGAVKS
ncbi:carbohydrate ABC transporter permease [Micromonospora sp. AMSO12t]|uniref:carbohydrate ABC transporter permease n=1 Tax=unclassified Micromonospora TaxID=2617518 RepID=UPI00124B42AA|nr:MULTISPECIES: carbohydrate ABC transporter permease [unclassified Micromonospora]KAB1129048.1 carbohydrate ABC transporter permease [Micromonospora sp. AMSO12t]WSG05058.1 carbohydrate ABC transporter permease [Micromonospora sp. NBC_01740]